MKSALAFALFVALGAAQQGGENIEECGRMCVNNMLGKAQDLGCKKDDMDCLCKNPDFGFGVRDCTSQACPNDDLEAVISAGKSMCPGGKLPGGEGGDGGDKPSGSQGSGTASAPTGKPSETGGAGGGAGGDDDEGDDSMSSPISTMPIVSTQTEGGQSQETTLGTTTLYGTGSESGSATGSATTGSETGSETGGSSPTGGSGGDDSEGGSGGGAGGDGSGEEGGEEGGAAEPTPTDGMGGRIAAPGAGIAGALGVIALIAA